MPQLRRGLLDVLAFVLLQPATGFTRYSSRDATLVRREAGGVDGKYSVKEDGKKTHSLSAGKEKPYSLIQKNAVSLHEEKAFSVSSWGETNEESESDQDQVSQENEDKDEVDLHPDESPGGSDMEDGVENEGDDYAAENSERIMGIAADKMQSKTESGSEKETIGHHVKSHSRRAIGPSTKNAKKDQDSTEESYEQDQDAEQASDGEEDGPTDDENSEADRKMQVKDVSHDLNKFDIPPTARDLHAKDEDDYTAKWNANEKVRKEKAASKTLTLHHLGDTSGGQDGPLAKGEFSGGVKTAPSADGKNVKTSIDIPTNPPVKDDEVKVKKAPDSEGSTRKTLVHVLFIITILILVTLFGILGWYLQKGHVVVKGADKNVPGVGGSTAGGEADVMDGTQKVDDHRTSYVPADGEVADGAEGDNHTLKR